MYNDTICEPIEQQSLITFYVVYQILCQRNLVIWDSFQNGEVMANLKIGRGTVMVSCSCHSPNTLGNRTLYFQLRTQYYIFWCLASSIAIYLNSGQQDVSGSGVFNFQNFLKGRDIPFSFILCFPDILQTGLMATDTLNLKVALKIEAVDSQAKERRDLGGSHCRAHTGPEPLTSRLVTQRGKNSNLLKSLFQGYFLSLAGEPKPN